MTRSIRRAVLAILVFLTSPLVVMAVDDPWTLLPSASTDRATKTYSPYFTQPYDLKVSHANIGDTLTAETWGNLFGAPGTAVSSAYLIYRADHVWPGDGLATVKAFSTMWGDNVDAFFRYFAKGDHSSLADATEEWSGLMITTAYYRVLGYYFIPGEAEFMARSLAGTLQTGTDALAGKSVFQVNDILSNIHEAGEANFRKWYASESFSDAYKLVTTHLAPRANAVRDYGFAVMTSPIGFSPNKMNSLSGGILAAGYWGFGPGAASPLSGAQVEYDSFTGNVTSGQLILGSRVKAFQKLVDEGILTNVWEGDLFSLWFAADFLLSDGLPVLQYTESKQTALSIPQIVVNTILPSIVAQKTILSEKAGPSLVKAPDPGSDVASVIQLSTQSPLADFSYNWMSVYGREIGIARHSGSYSVVFPRGTYEASAYYNVLYSQFPYMGRNFLTIDTFGKGQWTPDRTTERSTSLFSTLGVTLNDGSLWANYINTSLGGDQVWTLDRFFGSYGGLVTGRFWSQFPQWDVKLTLAGRVGYDFAGLFAVNFDSIYTRALGDLYHWKWYSYEGKNLNYLLEGLSTDIHVGDAFNLNVTVKKDFLMDNLSSFEVALGGSFVF